MTEALLSVMDYIYKNTDIDNIFYGYAEGNYKSIGLCEKLWKIWYWYFKDTYSNV